MNSNETGPAEHTDSEDLQLVQATIITKLKQLKNGSFAHCLRYAFDANGQRFENEVEVSPKSYNQFQTDDKLNVEYPPGNPQDSQVCSKKDAD